MKYFALKDLRRADYNPRIMPNDEMESLMRSIEVHGFVEPIVVNINKDRYGVIVGGHQRLTAIEKLLKLDKVIKGLEIENGFWVIPVFEVDLTLEAEKQLNIGLNRIHGRFDESKLYTMIFEIKDTPDLLTTGLSPNEISNILGRDDHAETSSDAGKCSRCEELEKSVSGHINRSGHNININA